MPRAAGAAARGNARIHPRSKYAFEEPDFAALAELHPSLAPHLVWPHKRGGGAAAGPSSGAAAAGEAAAGASATTQQQAQQQEGQQQEVQQQAGQQQAPHRASLDFSSAAACRELTRVLLRHDFGLEWWVPPGQLVPPLTNRANYIHWLEDLLALSAPPGAWVRVAGWVRVWAGGLLVGGGPACW